MNENPQPVFLRDAKTPVMDTEKAETMKFVPVRRTKPWAVGFSIVALCYLIWTMLPTSGWLAHDAATRITHGEKSLSEYPTTTRKLVPLEAHVMSKCPDTRDCLKLMVSSRHLRKWERGYWFGFRCFQQCRGCMPKSISHYRISARKLGTNARNIITAALFLTFFLGRQITMECPACMVPRSVWEILLSYALQSYSKLFIYIYPPSSTLWAS